MKKGTFKGVDEKASTITFCPEGTTENIVMPVLYERAPCGALSFPACSAP
jgi:hypothetical protein